MLWKTLEVVEAVVWCGLVAMCGVVPVCCTVAVCCSVRCSVCCCCCCGVVVGAEGRAGNVDCSSLLPWDVATVGDTAATQRAADLEVEDVVPSVTAVVASVTGGCLVEAVEEENVEAPDAKAKAARC